MTGDNGVTGNTGVHRDHNVNEGKRVLGSLETWDCTRVIDSLSHRSTQGTKSHCKHRSAEVTEDEGVTGNDRSHRKCGVTGVHRGHRVTGALWSQKTKEFTGIIGITGALESLETLGSLECPWDVESLETLGSLECSWDVESLKAQEHWGHCRTEEHRGHGSWGLSLGVAMHCSNDNVHITLSFEVDTN